ncbi:MAG: hypothetical protein J6O73_15525 [Lachnospiraceae bacterium]|nr:hypothetical protein [Lachnospiraceae bacterium]
MKAHNKTKRILEIANAENLDNPDKIYQSFAYKHAGEFSAEVSLDSIYWVICNDKLKGSECEGCAHAKDRYFKTNPRLNWCNDCAFNPAPVLKNKYESYDVDLYGKTEMGNNWGRMYHMEIYYCLEKTTGRRKKAWSK